VADLDILHEDNHLLAVNKPAGLLTQGDETGDPSLVDLVRADLKARYAKPGNVYVGLVHRLDRPVSGVVLLAKTSKAAGRLSEQFRAGSVQKVYWAICEGTLAEDAGSWSDALVKDPARNVVRVVPAGTPGAQGAELAVRVLGRKAGRVWVELRPVTGRSHQLRVQLAARGLPIVGDVKYGSRARLEALDGGGRIALHARSLTVTHPTRGEAVALSAGAPADWPSGWPRC
jgi:23S rRNA pseudouridine1911/1915/1917 synthase